MHVEFMEIFIENICLCLFSLLLLFNRFFFAANCEPLRNYVGLSYLPSLIQCNNSIRNRHSSSTTVLIPFPRAPTSSKIPQYCRALNRIYVAMWFSLTIQLFTRQITKAKI